MTLATVHPSTPKRPMGKVAQVLEAPTGNGLSLIENMSLCSNVFSCLLLGNQWDSQPPG